MIALEFKHDDRLSWATSTYRRLLEHGFLVGCKPAFNVVRFYPPLTIGEEDIARLVEELEHTLKQGQDDDRN
jgi:acetylornithine/succinyldiaminopimelate/putrescine aminotransferase